MQNVNIMNLIKQFRRKIIPFNKKKVSSKKPLEEGIESKVILFIPFLKNLDQMDKIELLFESIYEGNLTKVKCVVSLGVSANSEDDFGFTPLMRAAAQGHQDISEYLISIGADPSVEIALLGTASDLAFRNKHFRLSRFLSQFE